jgi:hypothetical protein
MRYTKKMLRRLIKEVVEDYRAEELVDQLSSILDQGASQNDLIDYLRPQAEEILIAAKNIAQEIGDIELVKVISGELAARPFLRDYADNSHDSIGRPRYRGD